MEAVGREMETLAAMHRGGIGVAILINSGKSRLDPEAREQIKARTTKMEADGQIRCSALLLNASGFAASIAMSVSGADWDGVLPPGTAAGGRPRPLLSGHLARLAVAMIRR